MNEKLLIVIPAFNEEGNIGATIREIKSIKTIALNYTIVVVNDGSKDKTAHEANDAGASVISLPFNLGIGGAVQTGFRFAQENGFDYMIQIDGDGQHDPQYVKNILDPVMAKQTDLAIGSRFLPPYTGYQSSFVRRIGINFFAHLISFLSDAKVTDPTSGFRCFNRRLIEVFSRYYPQDFPEPEAIVVAKRYGAKVIEVPVVMRKRSAGHSSIRYLKTLQYMIKVTLAILLDKLKKKGV